MARYSASLAAAVSVTQSTTKQLMQLTNGGDTNIVLEELRIAGAGISPTAQKAMVEVARVAAADLATGTAMLEHKYDENSQAAVGVVLAPTVDATIKQSGAVNMVPWRDLIHLQGGIAYRTQLGGGIVIAPGEAVIVQVINGTTTCSFLPTFVWREGAD